MIRKNLFICLCLLSGASLAGCATYERHPLEVERHVEKWVLRDINVESIREYAQELSGQESNAPYDPSDGLSLAEAEAVALVFNPQLRMARAQAEVPLASARESGWWPDPKFAAQVNRFIDRGTRTKARFQGPSFDGINTGIVGASGLSADGLETTPAGFRRSGGEFIDDPWIVGANLSITIPLSGRLAVEQDWAWAKQTASWRRILISEWELLTHLRAAWLEWSTTRERIEVIKAGNGVESRTATAEALRDARCRTGSADRTATGSIPTAHRPGSGITPCHVNAQ